MYTVVYDPNTRESTEEQFSFSQSTEVRLGWGVGGSVVCSSCSFQVCRSA